jgi:transcriptional regulator of arginine metabolism
VKRQRQQALLELIRREPLGSQEQIRTRLSRLGHPATQSTISRDLEELGLVRVRGPDGRQRYIAAGNGEPYPVVPLEALLREFVMDVESSGNLLVVKTLPGAANAVADGLDRAALPEALGTVAGDNTILVVLREKVSARRTARRLRATAGLT